MGAIASPSRATVPHPAKFSPEILEVLDRWIEPGWRVLDPFAGTGLIHTLDQAETWGAEIEPEWATMHPRTIVGDALKLPFADASFDAIATSPTYGNRMADSHNAQERCKPCGGTGKVVKEIDPPGPDGYTALKVPCDKCDGAGRRDYKRLTYTHQLGRKLHPNNSGAMQWGPKYRAFHEKAWAEADRVLKPGGLFILNASDHIRGGEIQPVCDWHIETFEAMGYTVARLSNPETKRMGFGANREARVDAEMVAALRKPVASTPDASTLASSARTRASEGGTNG